MRKILYKIFDLLLEAGAGAAAIGGRVFGRAPPCDDVTAPMVLFESAAKK